MGYYIVHNTRKSLLLGMLIIAVRENDSYDYTALMEHLAEREKKETGNVRWGEVIKDTRK